MPSRGNYDALHTHSLCVNLQRSTLNLSHTCSPVKKPLEIHLNIFHTYTLMYENYRKSVRFFAGEHVCEDRHVWSIVGYSMCSISGKIFWYDGM